MEGIGGSRPAPRYFGDSIRSGKVLSEEERAAENVYIQALAELGRKLWAGQLDKSIENLFSNTPFLLNISALVTDQPIRTYILLV
jgi:hypothetical protein